VTFTVTAGELFRIGRVDVEGAQALSGADIGAVVRAVPGDIFVESTVDSQTAALRERYRRAGYRDVRIELVMEERDAATAASRAGRGGLVDVRLIVDEGAEVKVGTVRLAGLDGVSEADLRAKLTLTPGAPFYEPLVATDSDALSAVLFDLGYDRARVVPTVTPVAGEPVVDITYDVARDASTSAGSRRRQRRTHRTILRARHGAGRPLGLPGLREPAQPARAGSSGASPSPTPARARAGAIVVTVEESARRRWARRRCREPATCAPATSAGRRPRSSVRQGSSRSAGSTSGDRTGR
jgi:hypothetical protein